MKKLPLINLFLFVLATLFSSKFAYSQVSIEEIIVTGLKRESSLIDAPVAVTVFTAEQLEASGVDRPEDYLSLVSNVGYVKSNKEGDFYINMRGQTAVTQLLSQGGLHAGSIFF